MAKFILLFCCLVAGIVLRRTPFFDGKSPIVLNNLLVYFFIPILTLYHIPKIDFSIQLIWLSITPFLVYLSSFIFFKIWNRLNVFDKKTEGVLIMCSGIGSTSFVGFPVFELLYGQEGLSYGIMMSLAGTIMVFNTAGISTALYYSKKSSMSVSFFIKRLALFPPFIAFIIAIMLNMVGFQFNELMDAVLLKLTAPFSVLALLAIGMQIDLSMDFKFFKTLLIGQFHKLILAPLVIYIFMYHFLGTHDLVAKVCILGAAIGPMNSISIIAAQMGLNPKLAAAMPAIGIPVSIPLLFLIDRLLELV